MALRWCAAGMVEAAKQFRRVNGHLHLPRAARRARRALQHAVTPSCEDRGSRLINTGPSPKFHGTRDILRRARGLRYTSADRDVRVATYRPFHHRWSEAGRQLNARAALVPRILPEAHPTNLTVAVTTTGARSGFAALAVRDVPDLHICPDGTVCVPLHFFDGSDGDGDTEPSLFSTGTPTAGPRHNVTDFAATRFRMLDSAIEKDDIFFYVYGVLHAPDYRRAFAADLKKSLPRIPQVSTAADFWAFATRGPGARDSPHRLRDHRTMARVDKGPCVGIPERPS